MTAVDQIYDLAIHRTTLPPAEWYERAQRIIEAAIAAAVAEQKERDAELVLLIGAGAYDAGTETSREAGRFAKRIAAAIRAGK